MEDTSICRLCECRTLDSVITLSTVDMGKLSKWCSLYLGTQLYQLNAKADVFCWTCVDDARFLIENSAGRSEDGDVCWWPLEEKIIKIDDKEDEASEILKLDLKENENRQHIEEKKENQLSGLKNESQNILDISECVKPEPDCNAPFSLEQKLSIVQLKAERGKANLIWSCSFCNKKYESKVGLKYHMQTVHKECQKCSFQNCTTFWKRQEDLHLHFAEKHSGQKFYFCGSCKCKFGSVSSLKQHIFCNHASDYPEVTDFFNRHPVKNLQERCKHCNLILTTKLTKKNHQKIRKCLVCDSQFKCSVLFQDHVANCKIFCTLCPEIRQFNSKNLLKSHMLLQHLTYKGLQYKSRGFECKSCRVYFSSKYRQAAHIDKKHLGLIEQKFACSVCGKFLANRIGLRTHLLNVHQIGDSYVECDFCKRRFIYLSGLLSHIKLLHLKAREMCKVCGGRYSFYSMKLHYVHKHPNVLL